MNIFKTLLLVGCAVVGTGLYAHYYEDARYYEGVEQATDEECRLESMRMIRFKSNEDAAKHHREWAAKCADYNARQKAKGLEAAGDQTMRILPHYEN